jgi:hypothetical protein
MVDPDQPGIIDLFPGQTLEEYLDQHPELPRKGWVSLKAVEESERLEREAEDYQGPTTFRLPAGQTFAELLAQHPEIPRYTSWALKSSLHTVRFAEAVDFTIVRPLKFGAPIGRDRLKEKIDG